MSYAAFHAASALICERTGTVPKTHNGLRTRFAAVVKHDRPTSREFTRFLAQAYKYKSIADYETGTETTVSQRDTVDAIATARRFLGYVAGQLTQLPQPPSA